MTRTYKIAGKKIRVTSIYPKVHDYCKDYLTDGEADFSVEISESDIDAEKEKADSSNAYEGKKPQDHPRDNLELTAVYRKIAEIMPSYDTFVFHGSVVAVDGVSYLFTARSGTGKSTHTRLWRELLGEKAVMVNDDKPLISVTSCGIIVHGTPYNGKHRLGNNISVPLRAVCIIGRAEENTICRISKSEAYPMLLQQVYRPSDREAFAKTLTLIDRMCEMTAFYRLGANMDISAAETAYNAMKG